MSNEKTAVLLATGNVRTPKGRLSYPCMLEPNPKAKTKDGKGKYTTSLLIPPNSDLSAMKKMAADAVFEEWGNPPKNKSGVEFKPKSPFLDAAEKMGAEWAGWTLIRLSTTQRPGFANAAGQGISPEAQDVYAGRWAFLSCRAGTYDVDGNRGVSFFLSNAQLLDHDEPLAGRPRAESEFAPVEGAAASAATDDADPFA